jgi:hypothetical protein
MHLSLCRICRRTNSMLIENLGVAERGAPPGLKCADLPDAGARVNPWIGVFPYIQGTQPGGRPQARHQVAVMAPGASLRRRPDPPARPAGGLSQNESERVDTMSDRVRARPSGSAWRRNLDRMWWLTPTRRGGMRCPTRVNLFGTRQVRWVGDRGGLPGPPHEARTLDCAPTRSTPYMRRRASLAHHARE